jgi:hypothetical protein
MSEFTADGDRSVQLFNSLKSQYPREVASMFDVPSARARRLAGKIGMTRGPGELYRELPLVRVPSIVHKAVDVFALKLTKALHFHHTGLIVPKDFGYKSRYFTNASKLAGEIPEEVFTLTGGSPIFKREYVDLSGQFTYRYAVSDDGQIGMYTAMLRFAICVTSIVSFDPKIITDAAIPSTP